MALALRHAKHATFRSEVQPLGTKTEISCNVAKTANGMSWEVDIGANR